MKNSPIEKDIRKAKFEFVFHQKKAAYLYLNRKCKGTVKDSVIKNLPQIIREYLKIYAKKENSRGSHEDQN